MIPYLFSSVEYLGGANDTIDHLYYLQIMERTVSQPHLPKFTTAQTRSVALPMQILIRVKKSQAEPSGMVATAAGTLGERLPCPHKRLPACREQVHLATQYWRGNVATELYVCVCGYKLQPCFACILKPIKLIKLKFVTSYTNNHTFKMSILYPEA